MRRCVPLVLLVVAVIAFRAAQAQTSEWFIVKNLGSNTFAVIDNPAARQRSYANAGFVVGDDGVLVVDTLTGEEAGSALLAAIRSVTNHPVKFVINTHYHGDHVAGNRVFADAGATVIAHRNVHGWIHRENLRMLGPNPKPELKEFVDRLVAPTVSHTGSIDLYLANRSIQVRSFPGHTGGDSVVIVPDARVVFGGDLVWRDMVPNTIDGSTKPWIATLDALVTAHPGYTFVPGHGDVATTDQVRGFREYLSTLQRLVMDATAKDASSNIRSITAAVLPTLEAQFGKWDGFQYLAPANIADMVNELDGKKSVPQPVN
jgi:glyoxylase-like metal-dependent hydrolase (beta-lactamase superfamily II)